MLLERQQSITFHIVLIDHIQLFVKQVTIHSLSSKLMLRLCSKALRLNLHAITTNSKKESFLLSEYETSADM